VRITPENWDAWLESRPESANVEERRTPDEIARDNARLYLRNRNVPKKLVQFPPLEEDVWALKKGETTKGKKK
jgi:hypothetical protein